MGKVVIANKLLTHPNCKFFEVTFQNQKVLKMRIFYHFEDFSCCY
nr:MAG TPA: hypothetical protein [Caudoviricetes sp.]